ncbi:MAG TPA: CHAT domain-containing protein [Candidatus Polarisedimenticolia bacterium]|nr:CHAT domain-containing protein [Candidatus Polarisedimenticolia bacterium]
MRPPAEIRFMVFAFLLAACAPGIGAGEKEVPAFLEKARALQSRGDGTGMLDLVRGDRGTTYECVDILLNGKAGDAAALSASLASAYEKAFGDRAVVERVALFGRWTPAQRAARDAAVKVREQGKEAYAKGSVTQAIARFRQALGVLRQAGDVLQEGRCLANLSSMAAVQRQAKATETWAKAALETVPRSGDLGLLISLEINRAFSLEDQGDLQAARSALQTALQAARDWNDREGEAAVLVNLGDVAEGLGEYDEALRLARETAAAGHAIGNAEIEATALNNQAAQHSKRGDLEQALVCIKKAVAVAREAGLSRLEADFEITQAHVLMKQGRYDESLEHVDVARKAAAALDLPAILAGIDLQEAQVRQEQGRYREALPLLDAAQKRLSGIEAPDILGTIHEVRAIAFYYLGRISEAVAELGAAIRKYDAEGRIGQGATAHRNLGLLQFFLGDTPAAMKELEIAARMHEQVGSPYDRAMDLDTLGVFRQRSGNLDGARQALDSALATLSETQQAKRRGDFLADLAAVELASGPQRRETGLELLRQASALFEAEQDALGLQQAATQLAEARLAAGEIGAARAALENARARTSNRHLAEYEWKMLYLEGRVFEASGREREAGHRYADSVTEVERLRADLAPDAWRAAVLEDRIAPYRSLSRWYRQRGETADAYRVARMAKARTFVERLSLPSFSLEPAAEVLPKQLMPAVVAPLAAIQARLEPRELLLDFFFDDRGLAVFQVESGNLTSAEIANPEACETLRGTLEILRNPGRPTADPKGIAQAWRGAARLAGQQLFGPLLPALQDSDRLLISPNGPLHGIPFAALEVEGKPLVARWSTSLLPAAETLLERHEENAAPAGTTLVFGDPLWGKPEDAIPGSAGEARRVADLIGSSASLYVGKAATEMVFREEAPARDRLHLAAHGRSNSLSPAHAYIQLAPGKGQDGRLEAVEIASMSLPASLVVLSGCETGIEGGLSRGSAEGDERIGLARAFLAAGARSVVASLWKIDDREAQVYIPELYPLLEGRSPAEALAELQRGLISGKVRGRNGRSLSHPYYWAGLADYGSR